jgi:hypothetical protein
MKLKYSTNIGLFKFTGCETKNYTDCECKKMASDAVIHLEYIAG